MSDFVTPTSYVEFTGTEVSGDSVDVISQDIVAASYQEELRQDLFGPGGKFGGYEDATLAELNSTLSAITDAQRKARTASLDKTLPTWNGGSREGKDFAKGLIAKDNKGAYSYYMFQYNPTELSGQQQADWDLFSTAGSIMPIASFMKMDAPSMDLEVMVDCTDISGGPRSRRGAGNTGSLKVGEDFIGVWADIQAALSFLNPNVQKKTFDAVGRYAYPSPVILAMGPTVQRTVLKSVSWTIKQWFNNLVPSRALIKFSFQGIISTVEGEFKNMQKMQQGLVDSKLITDATNTAAFKTTAQFLNHYGVENFFVG